MLARWWRSRILRRNPLPEHLWRPAADSLPILRALPADGRQKLRETATLFLHGKIIEGGNSWEVPDQVRVHIAAQAALPILQLGLEWYRGWRTVIVYPETFVPNHPYEDAAGVVHHGTHPLAGEAWLQGPVILSWSDIESGHASPESGYNVVIHEFAHKLDMLNGDANGFPTLHRGMARRAWTDAFSNAFDDFIERVERGEPTVIDQYGAQDPAEFFAVVSETFFLAPNRLRRTYPDVYEQLRTFYRQDPAVLVRE